MTDPTPTEVRTALSPAEDAPSAAEGKASTSPKTYTQDELDAEVKRQRAGQAKADKRAEKAEKEAAELKERLEALETDSQRRQREADERELENLRSDPDQLSLARKRLSDRDRAAELEKKERLIAKRERELEAKLEAANRAERERLLDNLAKARGIDPVKFAEKAAKMKADTPEAIEELAELMAPSKSKEESKDELGKEEDREAPLRPDSGRGAGARKRTVEEVSRDGTMEELESVLKEGKVI